MDTPLTRAEHEEFRRSMEAEHQRIHFRIGDVEKNVDIILDLAKNVERLAANMSNMALEQKEQGNRLKKLEDRDGEMWRKVVGYAITAVVSIVIGYAFSKIGM